MPSILVVEHEGRYIERIQDALSAEGWSPRFVAGRPEALRAAASQQPDLVLVNTELPGAPELLRAFARHQGGPGAVALLAEHQRTVEPAEVGADAVLSKPFTDQELRLVVRRGLNRHREPAPADGAAPRPGPAGASDEGPKLTSADIFGDLLAEVESGDGEDGDAQAEASPGGPGPQPSLSQPSANPDTASPPPSAAPPPAAPPQTAARPPARSPRSSTATDDPEIARRLEQTLSGVLGDDRRQRRPAPGAGAEAEEGAGESGVRPADAPKRRRPRSDAEVDELLNLTLSSLDTPAKASRRRGDPRSEAESGGRSRREALFEDLDLSEIEALAETGRRPAARPQPAPEPGTAPEASAGAGAVPAAPGAPAGDEASAAAGDVAPGGRSDDSWADVAQEVERSNEVPPPAGFEPRGFSAPSATAEGDEERDAQRFGHYKLMERIAVGGMAEVWKARMSGVEGFQKTVAIKKILPQMTDNSDFVSMFIDEAKLAAQLNHPNITHIYDLGKIGRDYYIAMEYVEGPNLRNTLNDARRKGMPLPVGLALLVGARLASALDYAHRKRDFDDRELELVHRDVSPQNVLLSYEGDIKLCDFGIVKAVTKASHTQMGALKGKLQYMSPEQAWGQPVDARSDIFSLGSLLFEMLTGERLFSGDNEISVLESVRECQIRSPRALNPGVPTAAEAIVLKALAKEPEERYQNAGAMQQELEAILYQLKPAPSQGDLATWLRRLRDSEELDAEKRDSFRWSAGTATGAGMGAAAAAAAGPTGSPDSPGEPPAEPPGAPRTADAGATPAPPAGESASAPADLPPPPASGSPAETADRPAADAAAEPEGGRSSSAPSFLGSSTRTGGADAAPPSMPSASVLPEAAPGSGDPAAVDLGATRPIPAFTDAPELPAPPSPEEAGDGEDAADGTGTAEAVAPVPGSEVEVEEGGRRGLWLVVALILLAVAAGAAWYFLDGPGAAGVRGVSEPVPDPAALETPAETGEPATEPPAGEVPADAADGEGEPGTPAPLDESAEPVAGGEAGDAEPGSVLPQDLERFVEEQMALKQEEMEQREREKQRELQALQAEVARLRAQAEADQAAAETPDGDDTAPATDDGGGP